MDIPIFDKKILQNGTKVDHDGDKMVLTNVRGHDLKLTYRRSVSETWEVRMQVSAEFDGKRLNLYSSNATPEAVEFWVECGRHEFEQEEQFREAGYPKITEMLNKPKAAKRTRKS
jgi:hypothetical protein